MEKDKIKSGFVRNTLEILNENKAKLVVSFLIILIAYSFLYGLWKIPVLELGISRMSVVGTFDYIFIFWVTLLSSVLITLFIYEKKQAFVEKTQHATTVSIGGFGGALTGFFASVCPICQGIVIVGLGSTLLSIPTSFLTAYTNVFKVVSLGLLGLALVLKSESIYTKYCRACNILK